MSAQDYIILEPEKRLTPKQARNLESTNRQLKLLDPKPLDAEEVQQQMVRKNPRIRYSGMRAHMEVAAHALAVGANQKLAAKYAGVSERQIKKYYADPDFRVRIEELRAVLASKLKGRIMRELDRRTAGKAIKEMELLDMLRIFDRITVGGKGMGKGIQIEELNVTNNYEAILASLFSPNPGSHGVDFPVYESDRLQLSSGNSPE